MCDKFNADFKSSVSKRKASSCGDNAPTVMKQCEIPFLSSRKSNNLVYGTISSVPKLVFPESVVEKKKISGSSSNFTDTSDTKSPNLPDNLHLSVSSSSDFLFPKCRYDIAYIVADNGWNVASERDDANENNEVAVEEEEEQVKRKYFNFIIYGCWLIIIFTTCCLFLLFTLLLSATS